MIQMLTSVIGQRGVDAMAFLLAFVLTALTDSIFRDKLPHDHGRAFAVNGELSKGKARGSGLIFVLCIALVSLAFLPFTTEYVVYNVLLIASMLSGYLDDAAETAWNEYKKGIIDFVIAVLREVLARRDRPDGFFDKLLTTTAAPLMRRTFKGKALFGLIFCTGIALRWRSCPFNTDMWCTMCCSSSSMLSGYHGRCGQLLGTSTKRASLILSVAGF